MKVLKSTSTTFAGKVCRVIIIILIKIAGFLSDGKSLLYLGRSVCLSVCLQNELYLDETNGSKHLNEKCLLQKLLVCISLF